MLTSIARLEKNDTRSQNGDIFNCHKSKRAIVTCIYTFLKNFLLLKMCCCAFADGYTENFSAGLWRFIAKIMFHFTFLLLHVLVNYN